MFLVSVQFTLDCYKLNGPKISLCGAYFPNFFLYFCHFSHFLKVFEMEIQRLSDLVLVNFSVIPQNVEEAMA